MPACKSSITFVIRGPVIQENMAQVSAQRLLARACVCVAVVAVVAVVGLFVRFVYRTVPYPVKSRAQMVSSTHRLQEKQVLRKLP